MREIRQLYREALKFLAGADYRTRWWLQQATPAWPIASESSIKPSSTINYNHKTFGDSDYQ